MFILDQQLCNIFSKIQQQIDQTTQTSFCNVPEMHTTTVDKHSCLKEHNRVVLQFITYNDKLGFFSNEIVD